MRIFSYNDNDNTSEERDLNGKIRTLGLMMFVVSLSSGDDFRCLDQTTEGYWLNA